jgi:hypothetical protein
MDRSDERCLTLLSKEESGASVHQFLPEFDLLLPTISPENEQIVPAIRSHP